ncbi:hypothetical protein TNCV_3381311 [Trichonephila clavipes]|nr:hypothetical protein TNCV_3381311 [Trichonephila clavipes]
MRSEDLPGQSIQHLKKFIDQMSSMCLGLSSSKIKSRPTAHLKVEHRAPSPHPYTSQQSQYPLQRCGRPFNLMPAQTAKRPLL